MSAPTIKPGTRCECRDCASPTHVYMQAPNGRERCPNDAVRMVTIEVKGGPPSEPWYETRQRALCAHCAAHHEAKAGAR